MKEWGRAGIIFVAAMLSACAMAPGMKMAEPAKMPDGPVIRVMPITLNLLNSMEATRQSQVREIAGTLAMEDAKEQR